jgi:hypothetical protein
VSLWPSKRQGGLSFRFARFFGADDAVVKGDAASDVVRYAEDEKAEVYQDGENGLAD